MQEVGLRDIELAINIRKISGQYLIHGTGGTRSHPSPTSPASRALAPRDPSRT